MLRRIAFGSVLFAVFIQPNVAVSEDGYPDQLAAAGWKWVVETGIDAITGGRVASLAVVEPLNQNDWTLLFKCQRSDPSQLFLALQSPDQVDAGVDYGGETAIQIRVGHRGPLIEIPVTPQAIEGAPLLYRSIADAAKDIPAVLRQIERSRLITVEHAGYFFSFTPKNGKAAVAAFKEACEPSLD